MAMIEHMGFDGHPSAEEMAAYIDGAIGSADRERIEAHAADCEVCRRELAEVTAELRRIRPARHWRISVPLVAAAAVIVLLLAQPFGTAPRPEGAVRLRGPTPATDRQSTASIRILAPADESTVSGVDAVFMWRSGGAGASYQLTLTDGEGGVVWTHATTDTVAALPDTVTLAHASRYHWYVDGLLGDGRRASSGVHSFTTAR